ncbi:hypothetical protein ES708_22719 [subsurface metagenome]
MKKENEKARTRLSLWVSCQTKGDLDSIKHPGQSYDGIIQELIKLWRKVEKKR